METRELTCIGCPLGCALTVTMNGKEVVEVKGNTCKKGDIYARKEVTNPTRIVTTTVRVSGGAAPMINVKTQSDIPKDKIFECVGSIKRRDNSGTGGYRWMLSLKMWQVQASILWQQVQLRRHNRLNKN